MAVSAVNGILLIIGIRIKRDFSDVLALLSKNIDEMYSRDNWLFFSCTALLRTVFGYDSACYRKGEKDVGM